MRRSSLTLLTLIGLLMLGGAALQRPASTTVAAGTITVSSVSGDFYTNPCNSGAFTLTCGSPTLAFTQAFPVINFNPPTSVIPCSPGVSTRPFTDVVNTSCTGNIPAQGNGLQAGVGALAMFQAVFTGSFTVNGSGPVTFDFYSDDGWILGIGPSGSNQPSQVSGSNTNAPSTSPVKGYQVVGANNVSTPPVAQTTVVNFPAAGTYPFEIDYTECCGGPLVLTLTANGSLIEPPIALTGTDITATEGAPFSGQVATLVDSDTSATASEYAASIDWGDGASSPGTIQGTNGTFTITGSHTYADEGSYTITVTVTDVDNPNNGATATATATVTGAALSSSCATPAVSPGAFSGAVATFTEANPLATAGDFTASIAWGDSSSSAGTISGAAGGPFTVQGGHTYAASVNGPVTITTTITDPGDGTTVATCSVTIFAVAPGGGAFVIGDKNSAVGTNVTFWGAQWWKLNGLSTGAAPAAFKGFANDVTTPSCGSRWTTAPGNSAAPPAGPLPAYMAVIVSSGISQSGATIAGDTVHVVVVKTNPGYANDPGHAGTGTVVAQVC